MTIFKVGDKINLNGIPDVTIKSWPAEEPGWFAYEYTNNQGGLVTGVEYSGNAQLEFVAAGEEQTVTSPDAEYVQNDPTPVGPAEHPAAADDLRDERVAAGDDPVESGSGYPGVPDEIG